jgi:hypothetical protein
MQSQQSTGVSPSLLSKYLILLNDGHTRQDSWLAVFE